MNLTSVNSGSVDSGSEYRRAMRILGLNCRGLGNDPAVRSLLDIQRRSNPDVLFLSETHLDDYPAECLRRRLKMDFKIVNASNGRSGGVILF